QVAQAGHAGTKATPQMLAQHARMRAKLIGYYEPRSRVMRAYPESDTSLPARYARTFMEYREGNVDTALELVDGLLAELPGDAYLLELKGQMLFEYGRLQESLPIYEKAVAARPDEPQLRLMLARNQIELNS